MAANTRNERLLAGVKHLSCVVLAVLGFGPLQAGPAAVLDANDLPRELSLAEAVQWGLRNNPELAAVRQSYGIAAAGVVIARTYPHNPTLDALILGVNGPPDAGITNRVSSQYLLGIPVEIRFQGKYRREAAHANLTRTEWEIVQWETAWTVRLAKAFHTVLYQEQKLGLIEEAIRLSEEGAKKVGQLVEANKLRSADLILARTETDDFRSQLTPGRSALAASRAELSRNLGVVLLDQKLRGNLAVPVPSTDRVFWRDMALDRRPDLHVRQAAVAEANAKVRLTQADRFGSPTVGASYQYDQSRINFFGGQLIVPLPVLNTHRGEIQQREAERYRAVLDLRQVEVQVQQDVEVALTRLSNARAGAKLYETDILPNLNAGLAGLEKLFNQGDPGVDILRLIDMRRKLLRGRDGYLGALWEVSQAQAELAAAVADPTLVGAPSPE